MYCCYCDTSTITTTNTNDSICNCNNNNRNNKVKGKFGVAYTMETPNGKCNPCGWEIEFNDTPSQVDYNCKKMMQWISTPPVGYCSYNCNCNEQKYSFCKKRKKPLICSCNTDGATCSSSSSSSSSSYFCCCNCSSHVHYCCDNRSDSSFICTKCIKKNFKCKCCGRKKRKQQNIDINKSSKNLENSIISNNERTLYTISNNNRDSNKRDETELKNVEYNDKTDGDELAVSSSKPPMTIRKKINKNDLLNKIKKEKRKQNDIIAENK